MTRALGTWTLGLDGGEPPDRARIGGKAFSLARMQALGLTVPPAFVVTTAACGAYLERGEMPEGLARELQAGIAWLEEQSGRSFGGGERPLLVSVRSGAAISMPGMMDTVLNLGITEATEASLAAECGDASFARDTHRRFLEFYARIVLGLSEMALDPAGDPPGWRRQIEAASGQPLPSAVHELLRDAVGAVFASWNSRRARRYRQHHGIPDHLGTAVTVQAMVFGNADARSGTGVLFSRDPLGGEARAYGEYLPCAQGEDVVSGRVTPLALEALAGMQPEAHRSLLAAAALLERSAGEVQDIEFTIERGRLFLLQSRAAKLAPAAAVRAAVEMLREGLIDEATALSRVTPEQVRLMLSPRLDPATAAGAKILARGEGASPGIGIGCVVASADEAERRARHGEAVVLVRPTTSPEDLHGMIAARAIVTAQGGSTSHAAVVGRALGLPAAVGCGAAALSLPAGGKVTVDGGTGAVYDGALKVVAPEERDSDLLAALTRLARARAALKVLAPDEATGLDPLDLDRDARAADPAKIGAVLKDHPACRGAQGGAIASDPGVRAALAAGLDYIVASPVLPPLLSLLRAQREAGIEAGAEGRKSP